MATLRSKWDIVDLLKKRPSTTKEIINHFASSSTAIVMAYLAGLKKEHCIELKGDYWYVKLEPQ